MALPGITSSLFKKGDIKLAEKRAKEVLELASLGMNPSDGLYSASIRDQGDEMILTFRIGVKDKEQAFACQERFSTHPALIVCDVGSFTDVSGDHYCTATCRISMCNPLPTPKSRELGFDEDTRKRWLMR